MKSNRALDGLTKCSQYETHNLLSPNRTIFPSFRPTGMVGEACLPSNAYYPRTPDYTLCSGVHVYWYEHSDLSFVYGFMSLDYGFGTMTATTKNWTGLSTGTLANSEDPDQKVPSQLVLKSIHTQVNSFLFWWIRTHRFGQFVLIWSIRTHCSVNSYSFWSIRPHYGQLVLMVLVSLFSFFGPLFWDICIFDC